MKNKRPYWRCEACQFLNRPLAWICEHCGQAKYPGK